MTDKGNLIAAENAKPGTSWQISRVKLDELSSFRTTLIEGYCSRQSVKAGETIDICVSTRPASSYLLEVFRMGYYRGAGARLVTTIGPLEGSPKPDPKMAQQRLMECRWESSYSLSIPGDWLSGVYLGRLTTIPESDETPYWQSYIIFIVTDNRPAEILFQCSDNTWQAYNRWPINESLYTDPRASHAPGVSVSFDRPYGSFSQPNIVNNPLSMGSGEFLLWEFPLCYWLEQEGYDVTYCSNVDNLNPTNLSRCKTLLSVGHDEYWDLKQYYNVKEAIDNGLNVLWLSANSVYMATSYSPNSEGQQNRLMTRETCYGEFREEDPEVYAKIPGCFKTQGPDERNIIGARTIAPFNSGGDWTCILPEHWIFSNTGMKRGDSIPGLVGWEFHGEPLLEIACLDVVAEGYVWARGVRRGTYTATIFPGPKNNFVFNSSTIFWSQGLSSPPGHMLPWTHWNRPQGPDTRVQQITRNLLNRAIGNTD